MLYSEKDVKSTIRLLRRQCKKHSDLQKTFNIVDVNGRSDVQKLKEELISLPQQSMVGQGAFSKIYDLGNGYVAKRHKKQYAIEIRNKILFHEILIQQKIASEDFGLMCYLAIAYIKNDKTYFRLVEPEEINYGLIKKKDLCMLMPKYDIDLFDKYQDFSSVSKSVFIDHVYHIFDEMIKLWSQGYVHMDLKPENIGLKDNKIILCDLEFAQKLNLKGKYCGTYPYIPLNKTKKHKESGEGIFICNIYDDVYAYVVTLCFMLGIYVGSLGERKMKINKDQVFKRINSGWMDNNETMMNKMITCIKHEFTSLFGHNVTFIKLMNYINETNEESWEFHETHVELVKIFDELKQGNERKSINKRERKTLGMKVVTDLESFDDQSL